MWEDLVGNYYEEDHKVPLECNDKDHKVPLERSDKDHDKLMDLYNRVGLIREKCEEFNKDENLER